MHRHRHRQTTTKPRTQRLTVVASSAVVIMLSTTYPFIYIKSNSFIRTHVTLATDVTRPTPNTRDPVCGVESAHEQSKHRASRERNLPLVYAIEACGLEQVT